MFAKDTTEREAGVKELVLENVSNCRKLGIIEKRKKREKRLLLDS